MVAPAPPDRCSAASGQAVAPAPLAGALARSPFRPACPPPLACCLCVCPTHAGIPACWPDPPGLLPVCACVCVPLQAFLLGLPVLNSTVSWWPLGWWREGGAGFPWQATAPLSCPAGLLAPETLLLTAAWRERPRCAAGDVHSSDLDRHDRAV